MQAFMESWNDPGSRHAMLVHFPIVLSIVGAILVLLLAMKKFKPGGLTAGALVCYIAVAGISWMAIQAGQAAEDRIEYASPVLTQAEQDAFYEHEHNGINLWMVALPAIVLLGLTLVPKPPVRITAGVLSILAAGLFVLRVGMAAQSGGALVHKWGLGVPERGEYEALRNAQPLEEAPVETTPDGS